MQCINGIWCYKGAELGKKEEAFNKHIKEITKKDFEPNDYKPYKYESHTMPNFKCICTKPICNVLYLESKDNKYRFAVGSVCINKTTELYKEDTNYLKAKFEGRTCDLCKNIMRKVNNKDIYKCKKCPAVLHFGKHKNNSIYNIPKGYLKWVIENVSSLPVQTKKLIIKYIS